MFIHFVVLFHSNNSSNQANISPCSGQNPLQKILTAPLICPLLIFAAAAVVSGLANAGIPEATKSFCALRGFFVYLWAYWAFSLNTNFKTFSIASMLVAGAIAGLWATVEQLTNFHPFSFQWLQGTGFLSAPMAFSGLTQVFSLLALGIALKDKGSSLPGKLSEPIVFSLILVCNWLGVVFAAERSAWLGVAVSLFITCMLVSRRATIFSGLFIIVGSMIGWLALPVVRDRLSSLIDWQNDVSVKTRFVLWQKAWQTFQHSPIFGVGIRQFPHIYIPEALQQGHVALDHAHNNYLHILATTGLVGLCAYLYVWFCALKLSFLNQKTPQYTSTERGIYLGIFAGIVSLSVSGLFEYNFGTAQVRLAEWFLLAMLI
jgi:O-antigen ligase